MTDLKRCGHCHEWKQKADFYLNKTRPDGLENRCKVCTKKRNDAAYRAKHKPLGMTGKKHSEETKAKLRLANLGKTLSEEHKKKIALGNLGKHSDKPQAPKPSLPPVETPIAEKPPELPKYVAKVTLDGTTFLVGNFNNVEQADRARERFIETYERAMRLKTSG
jgi:hypothetical protein